MFLFLFSLTLNSFKSNWWQYLKRPLVLNHHRIVNRLRRNHRKRELYLYLSYLHGVIYDKRYTSNLLFWLSFKNKLLVIDSQYRSLYFLIAAFDADSSRARVRSKVWHVRYPLAQKSRGYPEILVWLRCRHTAALNW